MEQSDFENIDIDQYLEADAAPLDGVSINPDDTTNRPHYGVLMNANMNLSQLAPTDNDTPPGNTRTVATRGSADAHSRSPSFEYSELALDDRDTREILSGFTGRYRHWGD